MLSFQTRVNGIRAFQERLARQPETTNKAAQLAINDTARKVFTRSKREIMKQVNLTASYLQGSEGGEPRFWISQLAKPNDLRAVIRARQRPTSLGRFEPQQLYRAGRKGSKVKAGVSVKVSGARKNIKRAFLVNLKRGAADGGNVGLAIRVKAGEGVQGRRFAGIPFGGGNPRDSDVYLLYGPSVQQVFDDVAVDQQTWAEGYLNAEFERQFARLSSRG